MGKDNKALKPKAQVVSFVPTGEYYFTKGIKAFHRRDLKKASKYFQRAMQLEPGEPMIVCQLAIVYTELGDYQQSIRLLHMILEELDQEMTECHYFLANNYAHMGLFKDAYHHANMYIEHNTDGEFLEETEDLMDLLAVEAEELDELLYEEDDLIVKQDQARGLLENGEFPEAIKIFEQIIEEYPEYWSAYNNLALAYFYLGETVKAKKILEDVLTRNQGNLHALCNGLVFAFYENEISSVIELKNMLSKVNPMLSEHQFKLGATFALIGEHDLAYKWLKKLHKSGYDGDGPFYYWLAHSAYHTGKQQTAKWAWKQVIDFNPEKAGLEPWSDEISAGDSFESEILTRLKSEYSEERLFALFLTSLSEKKREIIETIKKVKLTSTEKDYFEFVQTGSNKRGASKLLMNAHETAKLLYEYHYPADSEEAGIYLLWFSVFEEAVGAGYDFKNQKAWAAAVEYVWEQLRHNKASKQKVATKYGLSAATVTKYVKMVNNCLN
ncbi:tetratricopeptide repeat protein [Mesobacillus harenae]|uniref:tetratricopeptide repeat protein n=1 Tax=Mesobacillus harenae TaxID=2213203 RepID=UPI001580B6A7|nr:tetratricopeptide repeat protein [Mesobacillus harenae]